MTHLNIKKTGGYDEFFLHQIKDKYKCPVCLLVLREPIQTQCGHRLCLSCSEEIKKRNGGFLICPLDKNCSSSTRTFTDVAFERLILQLKVKCSNFQQSCQWTGELKSIDNHLDYCEFQKVNCVNKKCSIILLRKELSNHVETLCTYRSVTCQYCNHKYLHFYLPGHLKNCDYYPLDCTNQCGMRMLRKEMNLHIADDCALTNVPCQFLNIGCNFKGMRKELDAHIISSAHHHHLLAMSKISALENEIIKKKELATKSTILKNNIDANAKQKEHPVLIAKTRNEGSDVKCSPSLCIGGICVTAFLLCVFAGFIHLIKIGVKEAEKCPNDKSIPNYVMSIGILGVVSCIIALFSASKCGAFILKLTFVFSFFWLLFAGNYYVIGKYLSKLETAKDECYQSSFDIASVITFLFDGILGLNIFFCGAYICGQIKNS